MPGEGLWKSAMGLRGYNIKLLDPQTGQAAWFGALNERGLFAMLALRVKVEGGYISQIEAIVPRPELPVEGSGISASVQTMYMPLLSVDLNRNGFDTPAPALMKGGSAKRNELTTAVERYFEAFVHKNGSLAPLAPGCIRRENGVTACNNAQGPVIDRSKPGFRRPAERPGPICTFSYLKWKRAKSLISRDWSGVSLTDRNPAGKLDE